MLLNETEREKIVKIMQSDPLTIPSDVDGSTTRNIYPWQAISFYISLPITQHITTDAQELANYVLQNTDATKLYHLHAELIHRSRRGEEMTFICSHCHTCMTKKEPKIPHLSIAGGVDFGWYQRLGLEKPNMQ
jgi:hypothetical protein